MSKSPEFPAAADPPARRAGRQPLGPAPETAHRLRKGQEPAGEDFSHRDLSRRTGYPHVNFLLTEESVVGIIGWSFPAGCGGARQYAGERWPQPAAARPGTPVNSPGEDPPGATNVRPLALLSLGQSWRDGSYLSLVTVTGQIW
jgi:hypothetical protein